MSEFSDASYNLVRDKRKEQQPAEHAREKLGVIDRFSKDYQKREFNPTGDKPVVKT
jgi:hypothetical protein